MNDDRSSSPSRRAIVDLTTGVGDCVLPREFISIAARADQADAETLTEDEKFLKIWFATFLSEQDGNGDCGKAFVACGKACADRHGVNGTIDRIKSDLNPDATLDEKLTALDLGLFGGGRLTRRGNTVTAVYGHCYCSFVKQGWIDSPQLCECTAGWCKTTFGRMFDREVGVEIIQTVLRGGDTCEIRISLE
ncbi:MAG: hypothetical protein GY835_14550 [bacterium]|nr:hypothetical protein [bacterium]